MYIRGVGIKINKIIYSKPYKQNHKVFLEIKEKECIIEINKSDFEFMSKAGSIFVEFFYNEVMESIDKENPDAYIVNCKTIENYIIIQLKLMEK